MEGRTDGERLIKVETEVSEIKNAIIRLEAQISVWHQNYPTRAEVSEKFILRDEQIRVLEKRCDSFEADEKTGKQQWPVWISTLVAGVALIVSIWQK